MSSDVYESPGPPGLQPTTKVKQQPEKVLSFKDSLTGSMNIANPLFQPLKLPMDTTDEDNEAMCHDLENREQRNNDEGKPKSPGSVPWESEEVVTSIIIEGRPVVTVAEKIVKKFVAPWSKSLVVKLFDPYIGYTALVSRLQKLWQPTGLIQVIDLEDNYYLVRFASEMDWTHALCDGPWTIMGTYLLVKKWHPKFSVNGITQVAVWVRFPRLPVLWYNRHFLTYLGNLLGETVKIDLNTQQGQRGRFARVAVLIDTSKPLLDKFQLNDQWYNVEYCNTPNLRVRVEW